jgi:hypothetical protein
MSSRTVNNYRFYCRTESKFVYDWDVNAPIKCPNDGTHNIDTSSISIVDNITSNSVSIIQSSPAINDNYRVENVFITVNPNQLYTSMLSWPFNIGILTVNWNSGETHRGDIVNCYIAPNTTIGILTVNAIQGDTILNVSPTVLQNIYKGYIVNITDGVQNINAGQCTDINLTNNTITVETALLAAIPAGSYIQMTIHNIKNVILTEPSQMRLATKHLNSNFLPAKTPVKFTYQNNSNTLKTFSVFYEYLY